MSGAKQTIDLGVEENVIFCGYVSAEKVFSYCGVTDLFVLLEHVQTPAGFRFFTAEDAHHKIILLDHLDTLFQNHVQRILVDWLVGTGRLFVTIPHLLQRWSNGLFVLFS